MNYSPAMERFFEALEKTPRTWAVWPPNGSIRDGERCCPINAVQLLTNGGGYVPWWEAARGFGLANAEAQYVVSAADNEPYADPALRARIIRACGLEEKP